MPGLSASLGAPLIIRPCQPLVSISWRDLLDQRIDFALGIVERSLGAGLLHEGEIDVCWE